MTTMETSGEYRASRGTEQRIVLSDLDYRGKMNGSCFARVKVTQRRHERESQATSTKGPVDAIFKTIDIIIPHDAKLKTYSVNAVTGDAEATAEVAVVLQDARGEYRGIGTHTDTMIASALAYIDALNNRDYGRNT